MQNEKRLESEVQQMGTQSTQSVMKEKSQGKGKAETNLNLIPL